MDDLVAFLRARYDDEAAAAWEWHDRRCDGCGKSVAARGLYGLVKCTECEPGDVEVTNSRVLAEIDAKRELLKLHGRATLRSGGGAQYFATATVCRSCEPDHQFPELSWPCPTLRTLARPYADHPEFREEWRP
ncbi:DUF6221 family protein [Streptomyces phytophilus]|uniref:DUF6221 family protein n=1 Tax=Streptomyces phytophilus TaxID=722715 RepID=UPI0015F0F30A|nr:DUF6221 family protein [Streptomyces phytophilus]